MFKDPQIYLLLLFVFSIFYHFCRNQEQRKVFLLLTSALMILIVSAMALFYAILNTILLLGAIYFQKKQKFKCSTLIFGILTISPLIIFRSIKVSDYFLVSLGLSFYTLKSFSMYINSVLGKSNFSNLDLFLTNIFFPTFSAGPIVYPKTFENILVKVEDYFWGASRIAIGLFKANYLSGVIISGIIEQHYFDFYKVNVHFSFFQILGFIFLKFLYTYINFSGYSDLAIGAARFFGIHVSENFNLPIFAKSIQEFWRRWHITLGDWVTSYLFFPLLSVFRKAKNYAGPLSTLVAFIILGLWHDTNLGYFYWGLGHGVLLASNQIIKMKKVKNLRLKNFFDHKLIGIACWIGTIFAASFLQTLANINDAAQLKIFISRFFGVL